MKRFILRELLYVYSVFFQNRRIVPFVVMYIYKTYLQTVSNKVCNNNTHFLFTFFGSMIFPKSFSETVADPRSNGFG